MGDVVIERSKFDAVVFDLDGVITKTAAVHEAAWARMFDDYLEDRSHRTGEPFVAFTARDYEVYVDGKPRYDGVDSFLRSRGIELPWGDRTDPPERETVCGLGNRKNAAFMGLVEERGVEPYAAAVAFVHRLQAAGIRTGLFSSSRNAAEVLGAAGLGDLFTVRVDGRVAGGLELAGKPDPAFLLEATRRLGATPERTVVVEDALSGVTAGRRGGFGLVIGVDRVGHAESLAEHGADVVVESLSEVGIDSATISAAELPSALTSRAQLFSRLEGAEAAVFLDYDGTLTPIVAHPDMAVLHDEMRAALEALAETTTVAIISGRDVVDVREKVGVPGLYYAGSHGFDIQAPSGDPVAAGELARFETFLPALDAAEAALRDEVREVPGAFVERKRFAIAVHYRQAAEKDHGAVAAAVENVAPNHPTLRVSGGKMIYELKPDIEWDKGKALEWLLEEMGLSHAGVVPLYLGDDVTDEDAFRAIAGRGIGILVGREERPSLAAYALDDVDQVCDFLTALQQELDGVSG